MARKRDDDDLDAYTVAQFCRRHNLSVSFYYKLKDLGQAPDEMRVASKVLISKEAAARWRRQREDAARAAPPAA